MLCNVAEITVPNWHFCPGLTCGCNLYLDGLVDVGEQAYVGLMDLDPLAANYHRVGLKFCQGGVCRREG